MRQIFIGLIIAIALVLGPGCKSSETKTETPKQTDRPEGEKCEHTDECMKGLKCIRTMCTAPLIKRKNMKNEVENIHKNRQKNLDDKIKNMTQ